MTPERECIARARTLRRMPHAAKSPRWAGCRLGLFRWPGRNLLGGPDAAWAFSGGPAPEGKDDIPNITPHEDGIGAWSIEDIAIALKTGLLPDFETFGGSMTPVQESMAELTADDREAIAAYLKLLPPKPSRWKK